MIEEMKHNIEARNLRPEHVFAASMIAGISSFGILNQAVVSSAAKQMGKDLATYYSAIKPDDSNPKTNTIDAINNSITKLQSLLGITDEINCNEENGIIYLKIHASKCRYCPKGVGHAELNGTLCPFPTLVEEFINKLNNRKVLTVLKERSVPLLKKVDDWCVIRYVASD